MSKQLIATVVSNKMKDTAVVEVVHTLVHPKYGKRLKFHHRLHVASSQKVNAGDTVVIEETRPVSKTKHHKIIKVTTK